MAALGVKSRVEGCQAMTYYLKGSPCCYVEMDYTAGQEGQRGDQWGGLCSKPGDRTGVPLIVAGLLNGSSGCQKTKEEEF